MKHNFSGDAAIERPVSDVAGSLNLQTNMLDALHNEISALEDRLTLVLRRDAPAPEDLKVGENATIVRAPLCEELGANTEQIRVARVRISRLLERLAV